MNIFIKISLIVSSIIYVSCSKNQDSGQSGHPYSEITDETKNVEKNLKPIQKKNSYFKVFGRIDQFEWAPADYQNGFVYDVYYYIPADIVEKKDNPILIFMHGGGQSTVDRVGANKVVKVYLPEVIAAANKYKFVAIIPATNGLQWGGHTQTVLNALADLTKTHLNFDTDRLGVSGHSMGGMGITRVFPRLVNNFSFVNPISAGMAETSQTEDRLNKMFNIHYSHQLGTKDHFKDFIKWSKKLEFAVADLENKYQKTAKFEFEWFNDAHVYKSQQTAKLDSLFKIKRDIYQNELYGHIYYDDIIRTESNIKYPFLGNKRYLWYEDITTEKTDSYHFKLSAIKNRIDIEYFKNADGILLYPKSKKVRLYLSKKIFNLKQDIDVFVNGRFVLNHKALAARSELRIKGYIDSLDKNTSYDDRIEFSLE